MARYELRNQDKIADKLGKARLDMLLATIKCENAHPVEAVAPANPNKDADGVYIIYKDGSYELFTGNNSKENVKYVGLNYNGRHIAVALNNLGGEDKEYQFLKDGASAPEESVYYTRQMGICAFEDFAGKANTNTSTKHLCTSVEHPLRDGFGHPPSTVRASLGALASMVAAPASTTSAAVPR